MATGGDTEAHRQGHSKGHMEGIADLIARRRRELAMTQPELAAALVAISGRDTVTRAEVSRWERGEVTPGRYWQRHLGQVLGVPVAELRAAATAQNAAQPVQHEKAAPTDWLRVAHEWLVLDPPQVAERRSGPRIGASLLEQVEQRVADLRRLDDHLAGGDTYALVSRELAATEQLARDSAYTQANGRRLFSALGELGQLAGWVAFDAGRHEAAARHYLAGAEAAREASRQEIAANNLSSLAYQMTNTGNPHDGALLAATTAKGTEREHPAVRALMLDRLAVPLLEATTARLPADHRRELALYLSWLAVAYADAREPEQAASVGARVLELSRGTSSTRATGRVTEVLARLAEYHTVPAVADLLAEARLATGPS
jgi:transcriptional regulator with XRE-family HTH domain